MIYNMIKNTNNINNDNNNSDNNNVNITNSNNNININNNNDDIVISKDIKEDVDIAYALLEQNKGYMAWRELLEKTMEKLGRYSSSQKEKAAILSEIHTHLCCDNRFTYQPTRKQWCLTALLPVKATRRSKSEEEEE